MDVSTTLPSEAFFLYYSSIYQRIHYPFRAFHLVDLLLSTHTACINVRVYVVLLYISTLTLLSLYSHFTLTLPSLYPHFTLTLPSLYLLCIQSLLFLLVPLFFLTHHLN